VYDGKMRQQTGYQKCCGEVEGCAVIKDTMQILGVRRRRGFHASKRVA
jgi:hypothetical protein